MGMLILGIDTSCDDTSVAVNWNDRTLSNIVSSQVKKHSEWGGVVPSIAKREHERLIDVVIEDAIKVANRNRKDLTEEISLENIDAIAVTVGPGLAIALEVGIRYAKELNKKYNIPIFAANHMEGHIFSVLTKNSRGKKIVEFNYPFMSLAVSGGHTELVLVKEVGDYHLIGRTLDDACGEAFDKVGKMLGLGYPAGAIIEQLAKEGDKNAYKFPVPMRKKNNKEILFSYSGLKTSVLQVIQDIKSSRQSEKLSKEEIINISASFQYVAFEHLVDKLKLALEKYSVKDIFVVGGVSANLTLRRTLKKNFKDYKFHFPQKKILTGDNASMIATSCYYNLNSNSEKSKKLIKDFDEIDKIDRLPNMKLF